MATTTEARSLRGTRIRWAIAVAWLLFWALMTTTAVQDYVRDGGTALWQPVLWEGSSMVAATILLLVQRRLTRRHDHLLARPWRWFALRAALLPFFCAAFVPIAFGIRHAVYPLFGHAYLHEGWGQIWLYESVKLSVFICMFALIEFGFLSWLALLDEKLAASRAQALLRQAQLSHLSRQMQPHFLFNALNTVSSLMHTDVDKADALLVQLADVLRAALAVGDAAEAPLATELRLARGYARVMQARYGERVSIGWDIDETLLGCQVPVMSLQPLVENVFKHTVERRRETTAIAVRVAREADCLLLLVEDDGGRLPEACADPREPRQDQTQGSSQEGPQQGPGAASSGGIGLANLRARLAGLHGDAASLDLHQLAPAGVRAELRLPCAGPARAAGPAERPARVVAQNQPT